MATWIALKARAECPECGSSVMLEGPWATMHCPSCRAETPVGYYWTKLVADALEKAPGGRRFAPRFAMDTSKPVTSLSYAVNKDQRPICSACDEDLEAADQVKTGTDGTFRCGCGAVHDTFPAPKHMQGGAAQIFLGVREKEQLRPSKDAAAKPVLFNCTNCGGNLKVTTDASRILTCEYCDVDLYLPQALWNALHPVKKRRAFWVRTR